MSKGIYVFFGVDGAGKTTTIEGIKKRLESKGEKCIVMRMNRGGENKLPFIKTKMRLKSMYLRKKRANKGKDEEVPLVDIYRKRGLVFLIVYYLDLLLRNRVAKKFCFKLEGTLRQSHISRATNKIHDANVYGLLEKDWIRR